MLPLDYRTNLNERLLVLVLLCYSLSIFQVLPSESFAVLLVKQAFLLTCLESVCYILDGQLERIWDIALSGCPFQIPLIFYFALVIPEE